MSATVNALDLDLGLLHVSRVDDRVVIDTFNHHDLPASLTADEARLAAQRIFLMADEIDKLASPVSFEPQRNSWEAAP